jgi:hypothetical protein
LFIYDKEAISELIPWMKMIVIIINISLTELISILSYYKGKKEKKEFLAQESPKKI